MRYQVYGNRNIRAERVRTGRERREFYIENRRMTAAIRRLPAILFAHHAPEGIRTPDHQLRKLLLYPTELQVHKRIILYNVKPRIARGKVRNVRQDTRQDWTRNPYDRKPGGNGTGKEVQNSPMLDTRAFVLYNGAGAGQLAPFREETAGRNAAACPKRKREEFRQ